MEILLLETLQQGLIYSIVVLGIYLSFRILDYADLSVDGTLPLGAAVAASMIIAGYNPWLATLTATAAGAIAGLFTGYLHTKFNINPLLTGILTMTGLYSVNLQIMGRANLPLLGQQVIFTPPISIDERVFTITLLLLLVAFIIFLLHRFLDTEIGLALRATGNNQKMITCLGVNTDTMKLLGLSISNAMVSLSGALISQYQGFADVGIGIGTIIGGLASLIIGEVLFSNGKILRDLIAVALGSIIFRLIIALVLRMGLPPTFLKLMTAIIVIVALAAPNFKEKVLAKRRYRAYANN
ncbi:MAG: ABC transporter permease [Clostridiaceae bacterium BRH_c20a]|nr:MAG: ABC transporter permease [Clostridiaceae bacterium BRH_c20a]